MADAFDLVILGSGSTAFAAALRAQELGRTVAMTESRTLGGTCVNRGCLPSKNLIEAARVYREAAHPRFPGLRSRGVDLDFATLVAQKDELTADYREKRYRAIVRESDRIRVYEGHARFAPDGAVEVDGRKLRGQHYLIATGSRPAVPPVEGLDRVPFLTSDLLTSGEAEELRELPGSLVILGGGYIALELGQMFARFGVEVTLLERSRRVLPAYEPEVSLAVTKFLTEEGVRVVTEVTPRTVRQVGDQVEVLADRGGHPFAVRAERLLVAAGRLPNTDGLGLEHVGVRTDDRGFVAVDEYLRTTAPNVWAAGDVIGRYTGAQMATPVGAHDGVLVAMNAFSGELRKVDHTVARTLA
ncbi:MAG: FAD-dependent oxidoreductase [Armatimonadota bacterium]|nr:FAD-dependent oxidoreductase [Armatimonadota bacterium]MDR7440487.1 FAD-dependent oxidoreductase [Armatimonadota bacterium]MDR7443979.1 FAD-dependent oxidoreductase [Armatimonadota bacterium]MDR7615418.1 FAD-dependent oxidoreductase [Armatimonadota bacterium]